jgi:putative NADPH-quinone reductase
MKALIVYAHPDQRSMNHTMLAVIHERFVSNGWGVAVSDLYANGSRAIPSQADFIRLRDPERFSLAHEQRHAQLTRCYAADILAEQDKVASADLIVFEFPLWWHAVPAIMKAWAERILSHGFAYDDEHVFERGLLRGKLAMLSLTTGGTRAELDADSRYTGTVEQFLKPFVGGVLAYCGMGVLDPFIAYAVGRMNEGGRRTTLDLLRSRIDGVARQAGRGAGRNERVLHA